MARPYLRDAKLEQVWRQYVRQWQSSGQTIRAFCSHNNLAESNFYAWKRELSKRDAERAATGATMPQPSRTSGSTASKLVPVRVVTDSYIEIVWPSGVMLRAPAMTAPAVVSQWVAAVAAASC